MKEIESSLWGSRDYEWRKVLLNIDSINYFQLKLPLPCINVEKHPRDMKKRKKFFLRV